jgi:hypothetical protein
MQDYIVETKIADDNSLTIKGLPFCVGDKVEVIIRPSASLAGKKRIILFVGSPYVTLILLTVLQRKTGKR